MGEREEHKKEEKEKEEDKDRNGRREGGQEWGLACIQRRGEERSSFHIKNYQAGT